MFILCLAFLRISSIFFFFFFNQFRSLCEVFTEQPSTLHDNQLIQSQSEWKQKSLRWHRRKSAHLSCDTLSFCCEGAKISVSIFKWDKILPSPKQNGGPKGDTESSLVYLYLFVGCLNFFLPRGKQKRLQREEGEREGERDWGSAKWFELGLWVDSQPNQLVVSKVPDMQFPLCQPPEIPLNVSSSLTFSLNRVYWHACEFFRNPTGRHYERSSYEPL